MMRMMRMMAAMMMMKYIKNTFYDVDWKRMWWIDGWLAGCWLDRRVWMDKWMDGIDKTRIEWRIYSYFYFHVRRASLYLRSTLVPLHSSAHHFITPPPLPLSSSTFVQTLPPKFMPTWLRASFLFQTFSKRKQHQINLAGIFRVANHSMGDPYRRFSSPTLRTTASEMAHRWISKMNASSG